MRSLAVPVSAEPSIVLSISSGNFLADLSSIKRPHEVAYYVVPPRLYCGDRLFESTSAVIVAPNGTGEQGASLSDRRLTVT